MAVFILILGIVIYLTLPFLYYQLIKSNRKPISKEKSISRIMVYGLFLYLSIRLISESLGIKMGGILNLQFLYYAIVQVLFFAFAFIYAGFIWHVFFKRTES